VPLEKITGKTRDSGQSRTHAHYAGEFGSARQPGKQIDQASAEKSAAKAVDGSQKLSKDNSKDPHYRAARAQHFAKEALTALTSHAKAKTPEEKLQHEATIAHAADRAAVHARFVTKVHPGSELADEATKHAKIAKHAHEEVQSSKTDAHEEAKTKKIDVQKAKDNEEKATHVAQLKEQTAKAKEHADEARKQANEAKKHAEEAKKSVASETKSEKTGSLRTAEIASAADLGGGQNSSQVITFKDGSKAVFKPSEGEVRARPNIDPGTYYQREVAASNLAAHFGMHDMIPETVVRDHGGKVGSMQRWKDGTQLTSDPFHGPLDGSMKSGHKFNQEDSEKIRVFDYVVGNSDRHAHNLLVGTKADGSPHPILIDHGLSFPKGEPVRFIQPVSSMTIKDELHRNTQKMIDSIDLRHVAQTLHAAGIEKEAIRHSLLRAKAIKEDSSIMQPQSSEPGHDGWELFTHNVGHMVSKGGKSEIDTIIGSL
jgi:chemotaxis protein histidine kinase CheA